MTQRTYLEELPRDITNFMQPYIEGDIPTYRAIATEIFDRGIASPNGGFRNARFLNRDAMIDFFTEQLLKHYGPNIVPADFVNAIRKMSSYRIYNYYFHNMNPIVNKMLQGFGFGPYESCESLYMFEVVKRIIQDGIANRLRELGYLPNENIIRLHIKTKGTTFPVYIDVFPSTTMKNILDSIGGRALSYNGTTLLSPDTTIEQLGLLTNDTLVRIDT